MIVRTRFTLDTNILVYAVDRDDGDRHRQSLAVVRRAAVRDCVLSVQALAEFFHVTTRKRLLEPAIANEFIRDWLTVFDVVAADEKALVDAIGFVTTHHLSFWDAMITATSIRAGCSAILSEDMQDGRQLAGIEVVNPFAEGAQTRLDRLLSD